MKLKCGEVKVEEFENIGFCQEGNVLLSENDTIHDIPLVLSTILSQENVSSLIFSKLSLTSSQIPFNKYFT